VAQVAVATLAMSASVIGVAMLPAPALARALAGTLVGAVVFILALRVLRVLQGEDRHRLLIAADNLPQRFRLSARRLVTFLIPVSSVDVSLVQR
jgi:hypothetical protein